MVLLCIPFSGDTGYGQPNSSWEDGKQRKYVGVGPTWTPTMWIQPWGMAHVLVLLWASEGCSACCAPLGADLRCRSTASCCVFPAAWEDMGWLCLLNDAFNSARQKTLTDRTGVYYFDTYGERLGKEEEDVQLFRRGIFKEDAEGEAVGNWYA